MNQFNLTYEGFLLTKKKEIPKSSWDLMSNREREEKLKPEIDAIVSENDPYAEENWNEDNEEELDDKFHAIMVGGLVSHDDIWVYYNGFIMRLENFADHVDEQDVSTFTGYYFRLLAREFKMRVVEGEDIRNVCLNIADRLKKDSFMILNDEAQDIIEFWEVVKKIRKHK